MVHKRKEGLTTAKKYYEKQKGTECKWGVSVCVSGASVGLRGDSSRRGENTNSRRSGPR